MDVGKHTSRRNGDTAEQLVQLFVVAYSELNVPGDDAASLVVAGGIASELENLSSKVLHHCGEVYGCAGANALGVSALAQVACNTANWKLKSCLGALRRRLAALFATSSLPLPAILYNLCLFGWLVGCFVACSLLLR